MKDIIVFWTALTIVTSCLVLAAYMVGVKVGETKCAPMQIMTPHLTERTT